MNSNDNGKDLEWRQNLKAKEALDDSHVTTTYHCHYGVKFWYNFMIYILGAKAVIYLVFLVWYYFKFVF